MTKQIDDPSLRATGRPENQKLLARRGGCLVAAAVFAVAGLVFVFTGVPGKIKRGILEIVEKSKEAPDPVEIEVEKIIEKEIVKVLEKRVEVEVPPPMPDENVHYKKVQVSKLFNGIQIQTKLQSEEGSIASIEREVPGSFQASFELKVKVPKPATTLAQLSSSNSHLAKALNDMPLLVEDAKVSKYFYHVYDLKQRQLQNNIAQLDRALSRHNFYDCDTVLEMRHPESGRRVFFLQGEMDVVSDGSDGDRLPVFDDYIAKSHHFQPTTSYGWRKTTRRLNPLVKVYQEKLKKTKERYKVKGLTRGENKLLENQIKTIPRLVEDLKSRSFLLAQSDPFIVIPLSTRTYAKRSKFIPNIGDYAVVAYRDKLYPAIVGDYGPSTKTGEASLRLAKEIDPRASPYRRPVSDLLVSYFIFPKTADKPFSAPDLKKWQARCKGLLDEIGGLGEGYTLHEWEDHFAPAPEPEPAAGG